MDNFDFYSPTYFVFGKARQHETGKYAKQYGATKVLLHYGKGSVIKSGLLEQVKKSLDDAGIAYAELGGVEPNPKADIVYEGIELVRKEKVDFIIAVGGGSAIDSAKAIAIGALYDGDFWDFYVKRIVVEKAVPIGVVLTIAAAGSEGSPSSVITKDGNKRSLMFGSDLVRPKFAVLNPELPATLPPYQVACGGTDIMAHLLERYFTNTKNVETTDRMIEALLLTMIEELPKVVKNPADYESMANVMWAGSLAHNNVVGVGRSQDWASHRIEHELSALYGIAHGAGLAVVFPAWMKYTYEHDVERFARLAKNVWGIENGDKKEMALKAIQSFKDFWSSIGMPTTFEQINGKKEDIPFLAKNVTYTNAGDTVGGFVPLKEDDVVKIYGLMSNDK
ncbi:MAG: iron-containing alcohol dehydrogenase [Lactobacillus sp.]|jgi:alcohol dehydrogenase YqhD (iron-dependent ADH family)|nr:iron-containing alcohol dehydrogenase [Lactobacillus sp.]